MNNNISIFFDEDKVFYFYLFLYCVDSHVIIAGKKIKLNLSPKNILRLANKVSIFAPALGDRVVKERLK